MIFINMLRSKVVPSVAERVMDAVFEPEVINPTEPVNDPGFGMDAESLGEAMFTSVASDCITILKQAMNYESPYFRAELAMRATVKALDKLDRARTEVEKLADGFSKRMKY